MTFQPQPSSPVQVIPSGTVQFHGTTYFPQMQRPAHTIPSPPQYPWNFSPVMQNVPAHYSPYSTESHSFHSPYYETMSISGVPAPASVPRAFATIGPDVEELHRLARLPRATLAPAAAPPVARATSDDPARRDRTTTPSIVGEDTFPYQPPPPGQQKPGHAKRVSVTLKSKEDLDALRGTAPPHKTTRRESWMVHRGRDDPSHRVSTSGTRPPHGHPHH